MKFTNYLRANPTMWKKLENLKYFRAFGNIPRVLSARVFRGTPSMQQLVAKNRSQRSDHMSVAIEIERTPNPKALKFILNQMVRHGGKLTIKAKEEAEDLPLARDLFALEH